MSIHAQKWAWDQNIPNVAAKFLLVALADQTDARNGAVCYQETTPRFFSQKCGISERTFWRCVAALEANGYLRRISGRGRGGLTEFCLAIERPAEFADPWGKSVKLADFQPNKICQIASENVPNSVEKCDSERTFSGGVHNTLNQSTKETNAHTRARDETRASARQVAATPALKNKPQFVCRGTRHWRALEALYAKLGKPWMDRPVLGQGEHANHTGRYFLLSELTQALHEAAARGPPDDDATTSDDDAATTHDEPGNDSDAWQSARGLRGAEGSVEDWRRDRAGRSSSAYG